jgi:hypothetical protein
MKNTNANYDENLFPEIRSERVNSGYKFGNKFEEMLFCTG